VWFARKIEGILVSPEFLGISHKLIYAEKEMTRCGGHRVMAIWSSHKRLFRILKTEHNNLLKELSVGNGGDSATGDRTHSEQAKQIILWKWNVN
jgi:hypothetical protein